MHREILETKAFCIRHRKFLEGMRDLLKAFTENAEVLLSSEHAVCIFLKAYETQNISADDLDPDAPITPTASS